MIVRGSLSREGVQIELYGPDDLRKSDYGSDMLPENWVRLTLPEDEARALLDWLRGDRQADYRSSRLTVRGPGDSLIIEGAGSAFTIRLGSVETVASLTDGVSRTLGMILGRGVDTADL